MHGHSVHPLHCLHFHPGADPPADASGALGAWLHSRLGVAEVVFALAAMQDSLCNSNLFQDSQA
jgi:hypothetical protein